jgi:hypothetical protein
MPPARGTTGGTSVGWPAVKVGCQPKYVAVPVRCGSSGASQLGDSGVHGGAPHCLGGLVVDGLQGGVGLPGVNGNEPWLDGHEPIEEGGDLGSGTGLKGLVLALRGQASELGGGVIG